MTQDKDQMRAEFEKWARSFGTWDVQRDDEPNFRVESYTEMEVSIAWHAWQAARASAPPVQQSATPVLYASPEQLAAFQDKDSKFGSYLPLRKTPVGKFTQPLYTSPPSASSADSQGDTES